MDTYIGNGTKVKIPCEVKSHLNSDNFLYKKKFQSPWIQSPNEPSAVILLVQGRRKV